MPDRRGHKPGYEQKSFPEAEKRGKFRLIAGPDGKDGSVTIHQDARLYVSLLEPGQEVKHELGDGRYAWLQVAKGAVELNGKSLNQGDGAAVSDEQKLVVKGTATPRSCSSTWHNIRVGRTPSSAAFDFDLDLDLAFAFDWICL